MANDPQVKTCPALGYKSMEVCVPVTVTPDADTIEPIEIKCCGNPVVTSGSTPCSGTKNGSCNFTITQTICVGVPVTFSATAVTDDPYVDCLGVTDKKDCNNCKQDKPDD